MNTSKNALFPRSLRQSRAHKNVWNVFGQLCCSKSKNQGWFLSNPHSLIKVTPATRHIPVARPSGQPVAVQNCSRQFCLRAVLPRTHEKITIFKGIHMLLKNPINKIIFFLLMMVSIGAHATGGHKLMHMEIDLSNKTSLQKGARTFVNYCLSCHSAAYMRYNRMGKDLGITDAVLKTNFIFGDKKVGDTMTVAMNKKDAEKFFGVTPPDLSVIARSRGADWLYTYFKTFYIDESRPFGVNNLAFKDVGMPHVLWSLQGMQRLNKHEATDGVHHSPGYEDLQLVTPGSQSEEEYDQTVRDLVNFLVYLGEPIKMKRTRIGVWVMLYLLVFLAVAYMLKKEYWRDVH